VLSIKEMPVDWVQPFGLQIDHQRSDGSWDQRNKAVIADQIGKIQTMIHQNVLVEILEGAIAAGLEGDQ
jgi:hypothetical protein